MAKGFNEVIKNLDKWDNFVRAGVEGVARITASKAKSYAKLHKRWKNRTSHAVQGLDADVEWTTNTKLYVYIFHSVDYGVWLELANSGKYAILEESLSVFKKDFLDSVKTLMGVK